MKHKNGVKRIAVGADVQGLLFDCDGSLVDSMPLHMQAWKEAVEAAGAVFDYGFFFSRRGMAEEMIVEQFQPLQNFPLDAAAIVTAKHSHFRTHIQGVKPIDCVVEVARRFSGKLPMGVVSGGVRAIILMELEVVGIRDLFDVVITADDGLPGKPAPDMFLEGARRLGVPPGSCQVFEDGDLGLEAARAARMIATDIRPFLDRDHSLR